MTLALGAVYFFHFFDNRLGGGEPFAWLDGISAWPSIAIILFAALLSIHFFLKTHLGLRQNARELTKLFGLQGDKPNKPRFFGWEGPPLVSGLNNLPRRIDIVVLWQRYLRRGHLWRRLFRAAPMTGLYILGLGALLPFFGHFPHSPMRSNFPFPSLMVPTLCVFLLLTFVVLDAILLHEGFLLQLIERETCWPDTTFKRFEYSITPQRPANQRDLADYWDILLIAKRTQAVGNVIYYPFIILSLLIVARLSYFTDWTWSPPLIVALFLHFCLALYAAYRLPKVAKEYRDKVLRRLKRRRRQDLMDEEKTTEVTDTLIEEVQSTHQGAFSYLWEQPSGPFCFHPAESVSLRCYSIWSTRDVS